MGQAVRAARLTATRINRVFSITANANGETASVGIETLFANNAAEAKLGIGYGRIAAFMVLPMGMAKSIAVHLGLKFDGTAEKAATLPNGQEWVTPAPASALRDLKIGAATPFADPAAELTVLETFSTDIRNEHDCDRIRISNSGILCVCTETTEGAMVSPIRESFAVTTIGELGEYAEWRTSDFLAQLLDNYEGASLENIAWKDLDALEAMLAGQNPDFNLSSAREWATKQGIITTETVVNTNTETNQSQRTAEQNTELTNLKALATPDAAALARIAELEAI